MKFTNLNLNFDIGKIIKKIKLFKTKFMEFQDEVS
jgi:hypothetical protein